MTDDLDVIIGDIRYYIAAIICKIKGHDWKDNSYAGPESGYMGVECKRCGLSSGSHLY